MYSLSKGKFSIPSLWDANKAITKGENLIAQKAKLEGLYEKLKSKQINW
jgi:hypothetical protein